jgi:hypothetical protein
LQTSTANATPPLPDELVLDPVPACAAHQAAMPPGPPLVLLEELLVEVLPDGVPDELVDVLPDELAAAPPVAAPLDVLDPAWPPVPFAPPPPQPPAAITASDAKVAMVRGAPRRRRIERIVGHLMRGGRPSAAA